MSGGSFDYAYSRVLHFAEELRAKIANNGKEDDYGDKFGFSPQTITRLQSIAEDAERAAKLMKAAEWLYSGDTGEDSFSATVLGVCSEEHESGMESGKATVARWLAEYSGEDHQASLQQGGRLERTSHSQLRRISVSLRK